MTDAKPDDALMEVENMVIAHANTRFEDPSRRSCCPCFRRRKNCAQVPVVLEEVSTTQKVLVLDLDETLVHCCFHPPDTFDFCIPIEIEGSTFDVYIQKRPFVDEFLAEVLRHFYVVIFTASLSQYANPIIDIICPTLPPGQRLFRESCTFYEGLFVKDLTIFNTPLEKVIIVDNNPCSFLMHPENAIQSETWEGQRDDKELMDYILPILKKCVTVPDVRKVLAMHKKEVI